jgi:hypothetical protein
VRRSPISTLHRTPRLGRRRSRHSPTPGAEAAEP